MDSSSSHDADQWLTQRQADVECILQSMEVSSSGVDGLHASSERGSSSRPQANGSLSHSNSEAKHSALSGRCDSRAATDCNGNVHASYQPNFKESNNKNVLGRIESNGTAEVSNIVA